MALKINILMSSQQQPKRTHTKILEVLRTKHPKKPMTDSPQCLYFKIKPDKSLSELIIPYKDLKDNFPYALIEYFENKMKTKSENQFSSQSLTKDAQIKTVKVSNARIETTHTGKSFKKPQNMQKTTQKQKKIILEENQNEQGMELIHDYDKYLQDNSQPFKTFPTIFSEYEPIENRYLKDLRNNDNSYGRNEYNLEVRRKKQRIDYTE